ncbi:S8 family serine peptidase [Shewanella avicenniae]|uniref:S8 family serine peptidase n=1 Tax=Shewanella avicenniae TaxID=2814294 RepID=A0ABX7QTI2_9GAMM|nr:S8 family serine peptidase [Shewanella avicenniae]QSX34788.1 S8 family serine peptidase [Shewanella avicenniae]
MRHALLPVAAITLLFSGALVAAEGERYIVKFKQGKGPAVKAMLAANGAKLELDLALHDAAAFTLPAQALHGLQHNPNIDYVEPDVKRYPLMQTTPYGIAMVQADQVSDANTGNMTVCIIDSGYQISHDDLVGNSVSGVNDPGTGNWYDDQNHHGTHVAGTIAAYNNNVGVVGVNPNGNLNLFIVKVFNADGWGYSSSLISALDNCRNAGANVVNMSLGGSFKSRTEERAFANADSAGVLSIAAAGNDGNSRSSYPASYAAVVSVAAVDSNKQRASFSQYNSQVELAAPGVLVQSSVPMGTGDVANFVVNNQSFEAIPLAGAPALTAAGDLVNCGTGESLCNAAGKLCLIARGNIAFSDKVLACQDSGGVGAIIYNNVAGNFAGTLGGVATVIPSVSVSDTDGATLLASLPTAATLAVSLGNYAFFDGTSMATPHVAGVAALVWSHFPQCSNSQIRSALQATAEDLGSAGRDVETGYGLVQAKVAFDYLTRHGCDGVTNGGGGGNTGGDTSCRGKKCQ